MSESQYRQAYMKGYVFGKRLALEAYANEIIDEHDVVPLSVIEDIKAEIQSLKGTFPSSYYVKIIDKHIRKEQE